MVTAASKYMERLDHAEANLENEAYRIVAKIQDIILDYVHEEQLFKKGIDGRGVRLEPYSAFTIALKKIKGEVYDRTTLLDEGDFYQNMYVYARSRMYFIDSSDYKAPLLKEKYSDSIMVVTDENNKIINEEHILPELVKWLIQILTNGT